MTTPQLQLAEEQINDILVWFYSGDEDRYTPEAWLKHKANARKQFQALLTASNPKEPQKAWQDFEAKYKISEKYAPNEQIIYMAFEAGYAASNREARIVAKTQILSTILAVLEDYTHYHRTCIYCGRNWWGLHCPHDGIQNPCPSCSEKPKTVPGDIEHCDCEFAVDVSDYRAAIIKAIGGKL